MEYPRFRGQAAIITGSTRGIGRAVAEALAREGAGVVVNGRDPQGVEAAVQEIRSSGGRAIPVLADVSDPASVRRMVAACLDSFGRIDILVNNAGGGSFVRDRYLEDSLEEEWGTLLGINLVGQLNCCKAVIPTMKSQKRGRIVNLSSSAGRATARMTNPVYGASKAGVVGLTRQLAADLGSYGITVNAVAPGTTESERVLNSLASKGPEFRQAILEKIPLQRLATVEEMVGPVLFLASDEASYITGITLDVNGGFYMG